MAGLPRHPFGVIRLGGAPRSARRGTDVEHGCLLKSMDLGTAATGSQVTRRTGATFLASTSKRARGPFDASVDPTDARKATVRRFGRSDRSRLRPGDGLTPEALRVKVRNTAQFGPGVGLGKDSGRGTSSAWLNHSGRRAGRGGEE
jgi:hypothetical protein